MSGLIHRCPKCPPERWLRRVVVPTGAEEEGIEIDVCDGCRGVWLDWDEIGELKELSGLLPSFSANTQWRRDLDGGPCPACDGQHALVRLPVGAFGVDRCPECLGLWFDGGELGPMLTDHGFERLLETLRKHPA